jgi:hypothetical protein
VTDRRPARQEDLRLDDLLFADYWPAGSPELVLHFLKTQYDPRTMPRIAVNQDEEGNYWLIGWQAADHPEGIGLLEAARGWGLTSEEKRWADLSVALLDKTMGTIDGSTRHDARRDD